MCRFLMILITAGCVTGALCRQAAGGQPPVDAARAKSAGIRTLSSRHLTLYTDLPSDAEVDRLPAIFDQAVPQWARYFDVARSQVADWQAVAYLIQDRRPFDSLGVMPEGHDGFRHGISYGHELWLYEQPTAYYRRHLLLHEGTHAFMATVLGSCGPGWYMEGVAELLATHHWDAATGRLRLRHMPASRRDVPMLGRIKLIQDAFGEQRGLALPAVLAIDNRRVLENEAYAWCWALARWLDDHPRYRTRFRSLTKHVQDVEFTDRFRAMYADDWADMVVEWQTYVATLDHNYDIRRAAIDFQAGQPLQNGKANVVVETGRGWQSTGLWLEAGKTYRLVAQGRYQIAEDQDGIWWCEPGGVTIEYQAGRPLGILLGAIDARSGAADREQAADGENRGTLVHPLVIGLQTTVVPGRSGTLYLRVNDSPGRLSDNAGDLNVTVELL